MRLMVLGSGGLVGSVLSRSARLSGLKVLDFTHADLDITSEDLVESVVTRVRPDAIINAAAFTRVDESEEHPWKAQKINCYGAANVANACARHGLALVHLSSDYVFDGASALDYREEDRTEPINQYGRSKRDGELAVTAACPRAWILRTSWVFSAQNRGFPAKVLREADTGHPLRLANDIWSSPTDAGDLAMAILELLSRGGPGGIVHVVGGESCTPCEWGKRILLLLRPTAEVSPVSSSELGLRARRPRRSILSTGRLRSYGIEMPSGLIRFAQQVRRGEWGYPSHDR